MNEYMRHRMLPPEIRDRVRAFRPRPPVPRRQDLRGEDHHLDALAALREIACRLLVARAPSRSCRCWRKVYGGESAFRTMSQALEASILSAQETRCTAAARSSSWTRTARACGSSSRRLWLLSQTLSLTDHLTVHAPSVPELAPPAVPFGWR